MKKYIILTPSISTMGGSEMYTYNKYRYLSTHGWDVQVFFCNEVKQIYIKELEIFKNNCIPDLIYGISYLSYRKQESIVNRIIKGINDGDEVVIESHLYDLGIWGELIASRIKAKNILNFIEENPAQVNEKEARFLEEKLKRREILNASEKSLRRCFGTLYKESYKEYSHNYMRAYCSNVVSHTVESSYKPNKADHYILSVGRLEKDYVLPTLVEVKSFTDGHKEETFNLMIIGSDPKGEVENKIRTLFEGTSNVTLDLMGYMYPIPSNLIGYNDVSIASANSVLVSSNEGVPTIVIDIHDKLPIGIFGRTTQNKFSRDNEAPCTIVGLLEDVLLKKIYPKIPPIANDEEREIEEVFGRQVDFLKLSNNDSFAYPVRDLYPIRKRIVNRTKRYLHKLGM